MSCRNGLAGEARALRLEDRPQDVPHVPRRSANDGVREAGLSDANDQARRRHLNAQTNRLPEKPD
jgi:hypothetical protein